MITVIKSWLLPLSMATSQSPAMLPSTRKFWRKRGLCMKVVASCIFLRHWCNMVQPSNMHIPYICIVHANASDVQYIHSALWLCILYCALCYMWHALQDAICNVIYIFNIRIEYCVHCANYIDQINMMYAHEKIDLQLPQCLGEWRLYCPQMCI